MATAELIETMQTRQQVLSVLSRLLGREVDDELLAIMREEGVFVVEDTSLLQGLEEMNAYLASEEASTLDLARDYAKAFCGAGSTNRDSAYPFESFYTSKERMLMQEARDDAVRWYKRWGLEKNESWHDCEDHVGVELEFAAWLVQQWLEAQAAGDEEREQRLLVAQRDFERDHLANWLPLFAADVKAKARTAFYIGLARFASDYVVADVKALQVLID